MPLPAVPSLLHRSATQVTEEFGLQQVALTQTLGERSGEESLESQLAGDKLIIAKSEKFSACLPPSGGKERSLLNCYAATTLPSSTSLS
eukprot:761322-Hanusia_phi.AAC.2